MAINSREGIYVSLSAFISIISHVCIDPTVMDSQFLLIRLRIILYIFYLFEIITAAPPYTTLFAFTSRR